MNFKTFNSANTILGENALKYLNDIEEKRIAIVMGGRSQQNIIDDIISDLKKSGKESKVVANIKNEPSMGDIVQPLKNVMNFKPDCILALGGGSVIDSAKALWIFYEYPDLKWEDVLLPNPVPVLGNKARLIAVPTTSGTGSETTSCAVMVEEEIQEKRLIISQNIIPSLCILDDELVCTMPNHVAANSGMDAFTHSLEAGVNKANNPLVQRIALTAILDIFKYLPISVNESPGTAKFKEARGRIQLASYLSGVAINNSGTGLAHTFDQIGPKLNIPHGLTCAVLLPYTVEFIGDHPFYRELGEIFGYKEGPESSGKFLSKKIIELNKSIGIPECFGKMNINEKDYLEAMKEAVYSGMNSGGLGFAPKIPTYDEAELFMSEAYYGRR